MGGFFTASFCYTYKSIFTNPVHKLYLQIVNTIVHMKGPLTVLNGTVHIFKQFGRGNGPALDVLFTGCCVEVRELIVEGRPW